VLELCGSFSLDRDYLNHGLECLSTTGLHLHQVLVSHLLSMKFAATMTGLSLSVQIKFMVI
jgi:hypothetical protein